MQISDCMKKKVIFIPATSSIAEAARVIVENRVGLLPVVDPLGKPIGLVRLGDLLNLELPDFIKFVEDVDFVHDFGAVETTRPERELLLRPVTTLMQPALMVKEQDGLLRVYALMLQHELFDVIVVNEQNELVGIASRVDIGVAILSNWSVEGP